MTQQIDNLKGPKVTLSTVATSTRQTAKTDFGTVMRNGLIKAGNVAVDGMRIAAPFVPGAAIVSAAVSGANLASDIGQGGYGASSGALGTSASGLSMGGSGPTGGTVSPGNYNATGALAVPGRRPGLGTDLGQPASNMSGGAYGATGGGSTASGASDSFNQMMTATRSMAEFQASFNLQYLQLQEKIQTDTRQFNLVSNIMKTKHDAAKNALNNVR
jgi:hypothetical protein